MLLVRGGHAAPTVVSWRKSISASNRRFGVHSLMSSMTFRRFRKGSRGIAMHIGHAAAFGGEGGGMAGGSVDDVRRVFILEDMTMDQLHDFHMRLCENDVEYHDLKSMCKLNGLGGKDMKYNLRAKLIRKVREMLGKPVWDRRSYGRRVKLPTAMSDGELAKFYKQREVVMPDDKDDAIGLAFAMLVVDGAISQDVVPTTSAYDKLNTKRLIQLCQKRNLPTKGNKAELLARLVEYDAQRERKILADKAEEAARRELEEATIDVPPRPPNRAMAADLREAQKTMASVSEMDLPYLRAALLARNLPVYGTSEVLVERLTNVLRRDVIDAHAGLGRLVKYAEAAVSKLDDEETYEALAARGLASFSVGEDSGSRLANALVEEWIHAAMMPNDSEWEESSAQLDEQAVQGDDAGGETFDPTLDVTLICGGITAEERETSIQSAREILPDLQSDQIWGTLMPFTSSDDQENLEDTLDSFDCEEPPNDVVDILYLTPAVNGVVATVSAPMAPLGTVFKVYAKPADDSGEEVIATGLSQDIVIKGLKPGTAYEFTSAVVNKVGEGPRSEPYHAATLLRQGVSVTVLYPINSQDGDQCQYTELSWEELYGYDSAALDALLPCHKSRPVFAYSDIAGSDSILLPLGRPSVSDDCLADRSALNVFDPSFDPATMGKRELLAKTAVNGYHAMPVLELDADHASQAEDLVAKWIKDGPNDSVVGRFRIEVLSGQAKVLSVVCRGLHACTEVIDALKIDTDGFKDVMVLVEPIYKDGVYLQVHVVDTKEGPVALVPTEIDHYDIEDLIKLSDIEISKLAYQNGEYDLDMLERVIKLKREDVLVPAHFDSEDGDLSDSRRIRHHTPPSSMPVELMNHARLSAVKIFKDMGLKDFARISFIVYPEPEEHEMEEDRKALIAFESGEKTVGEMNENYGSIKIESMASLLQKEEDSLQNKAMAEASLLDKDLGSMTVVDFYKAEPTVRYGEAFGVPIDDRTRLDIQKDMAPVNARPILSEAPQGSYSGLNDPEMLEVDKVNTFINDDGTSYKVVIGDIGLIPNFESKLGVLAQQLFASGLSWNWLPRQLVSMVASRLNLPELQGQFISQDEVKDADEDWVGISTTEYSDPDYVSLETIKDAIETWDKEPILAQLLNQSETVGESDVPSASGEEEIEVALEQTVATLNEKDELSSDQDTLSDMSNVLSQQFPGLHPSRQRVWILCGGEGPQRRESLNAAAAAMRALQGAPDLLLETFMLDPPNSGLKNDERLEMLVSLREDVLKSGATDDFLFAEMPYLHPAHIKHPAPLLPQDLNGRGVWRLAGSSIVRDTVEDMRCSIDRVADSGRLTTVSRMPGDDLHKMEQIFDATKCSFEKSKISVEGYRAPWGGSLGIEGNHLGVPRYLSLKDWVTAASEKCAVILMVLPGHPSAYGPIQELMDEVGVPYTGPSNVAAELCLERPELLRSLTDAVNYDGSIISAPPAHSISALELRATCQTEESADEFFNRLFGAWDNKMMVIRPAADYGQGMLRMKNGKDLMLYNHAVQNWVETIDAEDTTAETADVRMPLPPPTQFVIEPFLAAEPIQLRQGSSTDESTIQDKIYDQISWPTLDNWLEVKGCLLGGAGTMRCLGLSTTIITTTDEGQFNSAFDVTPPPPSVLSEDMTSDTILRLQLVSDRLGLSGAAEISLLINAETGEIIITEVDVHPDISANGLLMRQAAQLSPPMSHVEVMRELLKEAMSRGEDAMDGDIGEQASMYSADEFSASMGGVLDAPDAPNPTQNYFGDPYLKVEDGYQYGFEGFQAVSEDDEEEFDDFPDFSESDSDVEF